VGEAVDQQRAGAADALTAVGVERDRRAVALDDPLVEDVQHLQHRGLGVDVGYLVALVATLALAVGLAPDLEREIHL
jgi:hypothetical protein